MPLVKELKSRPSDFDVSVCVTGQHREMLDQVLRTFGIVPDYDLAVMKPGQTLFGVTCGVMLGINRFSSGSFQTWRSSMATQPPRLLRRSRASTSASPSVTSRQDSERGTYTLPGPRSSTARRLTSLPNTTSPQLRDRSATCSTKVKPVGRIFVTGNTGIDALRTTVREGYHNEHLDWAQGSRLVLLTAHRRESLGEPMVRMFRAVRRVMEEHPDVKAVYPIHMNPEVRRAAHAD